MPIKCTISGCSSELQSIAEWRAHIEEHNSENKGYESHKKKYKCTVCPRTFTTLEAMLQHKKDAHLPPWILKSHILHSQYERFNNEFIQRTGFIIQYKAIRTKGDKRDRTRISKLQTGTTTCDVGEETVRYNGKNVDIDVARFIDSEGHEKRICLHCGHLFESKEKWQRHTAKEVLPKISTYNKHRVALKRPNPRHSFKAEKKNRQRPTNTTYIRDKHNELVEVPDWTDIEE